jgi:hypothetical protein
MNWKGFGRKWSWSDLVLCWNFPGGTVKAMRNLGQDSQCHVQDLNQAPPEYKSRALPLYQSAHCYEAIDHRSSGKSLECYSVKTIHLYDIRHFHVCEDSYCGLLSCDIIYLEDGSSMFLWNIGNYLPDYMLLHPKKSQYEYKLSLL